MSKAKQLLKTEAYKLRYKAKQKEREIDRMNNDAEELEKQAEKMD